MPRLRPRFVPLLLLALATTAATSAADDDRTAELERRFEALSRQVEAMQLGGGTDTAGAGTVARLGLAPAAAKVYGAPRGVSVGGYGEMLLDKPDRARQDGKLSGGVDRLDLLRVILYVGHKFNDRLLFNSEFEWEHAGVVDEAEVAVDTGTGIGEAELSGEVLVEFAYLDWRVAPWLGLRAGKLLMPLGFINEMHEPPVFFGARRPDVERNVIPTTWAAGGAGVYGEHAGGLSWRAYVTEGLDASGFRAASPLRGGRQGGSRAAATHPAFSARLDYAGIPGLTAGAAAFTGDSWQGPQAGTVRQRARTTLLEGHARWSGRGAEARALFARGALDNAAAISDANGLTGNARLGDRFSGGYVELAYDVWPLIRPGSEGAIAPYVRLEEYDTQQEGLAPGGDNPAYRVRLVTAGVALKPHPEVILKLDRQQRRNDARTATSQWSAALGYLF